MAGDSQFLTLIFLTQFLKTFWTLKLLNTIFVALFAYC